MPKASGHGISAAVRESISEWITNELVAQLEDVSGHEFDVYALQYEDSWVRYRRARGGEGWERDYRCKTDERVGLRVHTNSDDTTIKFVTFKVGNRYVGGGKVHVPSVFESQAGRKAKIQNGKTPTFTPFSKAELDKLNTQQTFGESALLSLMMEERV
jgi:hypothetical protein